jgi:hypothetical protein
MNKTDMKATPVAHDYRLDPFNHRMPGGIEPVAWLIDCSPSQNMLTDSKASAEHWRDKLGYAITPLYAAPSIAAASPMSDLQHDIERHVQIASDLATENAMLLDALQGLVDFVEIDKLPMDPLALKIARAALAAADKNETK